MPPWSLTQLKQFGMLTGLDVNVIEENYEFIGGIARHAFAQTTDDVISRVNKCVGMAIANLDLMKHLSRHLAIVRRSDQHNQEKELV
jgi:hypothetical protein